MRLWHKDLIPVLPRQQLLGQWRECCAIAKSIAEKGTPGHILVNRIMDYPIQHFENYSMVVWAWMIERGYSCDRDKFHRWIKSSGFLARDELFPEWHNDSYLRQCYFNLQEKYDCGGISAEEWDKIVKKFYHVERW